MAKKGKFSQPRSYKPRDFDSDLSFLDAIEDPVPTPPPADPVPEASEPDEIFGEHPVEDAPAAPVTVANDPLLADAALTLDDLGEDDDGSDFEEDAPEKPIGKMDNRHEDVLSAIRTTGKLEKDTEDALSAALTELLTEFVVSE